MFPHMHLYHKVNISTKLTQNIPSPVMDSILQWLLAELCVLHKARAPKKFHMPFPHTHSYALALLFVSEKHINKLHQSYFIMHSRCPKVLCGGNVWGVDTCYPNFGTVLISNCCCGEWYICTDATPISRYRLYLKCLFNIEKGASHTNQVKALMTGAQ